MEDFKVMQERDSKMISEIEALLGKYKVTCSFTSLITAEGNILEHEFQLGVVTKFGLIEMAKVNAETKQGILVQQQIANALKRRESPILHPV